MPTRSAESRMHRWLKFRLSPSIFLLFASYLCIQAGFDDTWAGRVVTNVQFSTWMFFLLSWVLPLVAIIVSAYQLIRHHSLQHVAEIVVAVFLFLRAFTLIVKAG